jgi:hypothetical protein
MEQIFSLITALNHVVESSDSLYQDYAGAPAEDSRAWLEVSEHDGELENATGLSRPLFGAYADAEYKLCVINDLVRSFTELVATSEVNLGEMVVARSAIEVAARLYWELAATDDYRESASRWLREWLRIIAEAEKLGSVPRTFVEELGNETLIRQGAVQAGLNVPGPPPAAMDLVWEVLSASPGPLRFHGLTREELVAVFYRNLSAVAHGSSLGTQSHISEPGTGAAIRSTTSNPADVLTLISGVLTAYANAHGALAELYGWDSSSMNAAIDEAVAEVRSAYSLYSAPLSDEEQ